MDAPGIETPLAVLLANKVSALKFSDLSAETLLAAKSLLLDQVAVQVAGSTMPWMKPASDFIKQSATASGPCTIVGDTVRTSVADASFINASYGQACELDDMAFGASGHIGTATIPVALACGEALHASGKDVLTAIIGGYEVMYRMLAAISPHQNERGFHSQSIAGPFAAAAVAAKLYGMDAETTAHALAIAGSHASGSTEYDQSGGEVKRIHAGIAARAGVQSAQLAGLGLTGPLTIIEGKRGFLNIFSPRSNPAVISDNLDRSDSVLNTWIKVFPTVAGLHTSIDATQRICKTAALSFRDVAAVKVSLAERTILHGATIVVPKDAVGAQFSLAFAVALAIVRSSNDLSSYMDPAEWHDSDIQSVARVVEASADPEAVGQRRHRSTVKIILKDGRSFSETVEYPKGCPLNPISQEQIKSKARNLLGRASSAEKMSDGIIDLIDHFEEIADVGDLTRLIAA